MDSTRRTNLVRQLAREQGFEYCGIAKADFLAEEAPRLERWLRLGKQGEMAYMSNWFDKRLDPRKLMDGAKSVICLMYNYYPDQKQNDPEAPKIARYALGRDYHWVLKRKLSVMVQRLQEEVGNFDWRVFVDSGPVLEKAWAARAGLGWIGKNSLLLNQERGSYLFLSEIIVDFDLEYDQPLGDLCASCRKCQDACPTNALVEPRIVDARRCISYFTIEYRGELPAGLREKFHNWMFGCDICQEVCPWNRKSKPHSEELFAPKKEVLEKTRQEWKEITREVYNRLFRDTAVTRTRYRGLERNIRFLATTAGTDDCVETKDEIIE